MRPGERRAGSISFTARPDHCHEPPLGAAREGDRLAVPGGAVWRGIYGQRWPAAVADAGRDAVPGPVRGYVTLCSISTHSLPRASSHLGAQLVSFGAISRSYAAISGFLPGNAPVMVLIRNAKTDRLALGCLQRWVGVFGYAFTSGRKRDFGPLSDAIIPRVVLAMTGIVIGMQVLFSGFVLGLLEIPTRADACLPRSMWFPKNEAMKAESGQEHSRRRSLLFRSRARGRIPSGSGHLTRTKREYPSSGKLVT